MRRYVFSRVVFAAISVWGVVTLVFFLTKLIPGDAARVAAGRTATAAQVEQARERLGLDLPVTEQYFRFLGNALQGDLGQSASTHQPVAADLARTLPVSLQLVFLSLVFTVALGVSLGMLAASHQGRAADLATRVILVISGAAPVFWVAVLLQWLLASTLRIFPISGTSTKGLQPPDVTGFSLIDALVFGTPAQFFDSLGHFVLPAFVLSLMFAPTLARNVRATMIGALSTDFASFAVAKGVSRGRLVRHHAFRATLGPNFTLAGMQLGWMLGATTLIETTFALPGIGTYLHQAVTNQDTFAVLGCVLVIGVVVVFANLIVDLLQMGLDPRIRASHLGGRG